MTHAIRLRFQSVSILHSDVRFQRAKRHNRRIVIAQTTPFCTLVLHSTLCLFPSWNHLPVGENIVQELGVCTHV